MISRHRFPRQLRIRSGSTFSRVYREGRRARGELMIVVGAPNGLDHPRLGLSVGKRIWKSAVKRNRVRRVFRESFRLSCSELPPLDLVLIPAVPKLKPGTRAARAELVRLAAKVEAKLARQSGPAAGPGRECAVKGEPAEED